MGSERIAELEAAAPKYASVVDAIASFDRHQSRRQKRDQPERAVLFRKHFGLREREGLARFENLATGNETVPHRRSKEIDLEFCRQNALPGAIVLSAA